MAGYRGTEDSDYYGNSQYYQNDEYDSDISSPYQYNPAGYFDESSSLSSGIGPGSSAMTRSPSHSSHGSTDQYYPQSSSQRQYVNAYDEQSTDFDQLLDTNHYNSGSAYRSGTYGYEPSSSYPSYSTQRNAGHGNAVVHGSLSPEGYSEYYTVNEPSPISPSSSTFTSRPPPEAYPEAYNPNELSPISPSSSSSSAFPSRSRKNSRASKSDVSYPCLAPGCTSTARFKRVADLQRHYASVHSDEHYDCPIRKCARKGKHGLGRKDHLRDHLKDVHMQSPEQVKIWMEEVQIIMNLRIMKKTMPPEKLLAAQEMERGMPTAKSVLGWD